MRQSRGGCRAAAFPALGPRGGINIRGVSQLSEIKIFRNGSDASYHRSLAVADFAFAITGGSTRSETFRESLATAAGDVATGPVLERSGFHAGSPRRGRAYFLRRLREIMGSPVRRAGSGSTKSVVQIAANMVAEVCSAYVLRYGNGGWCSSSMRPRA